MFIQQVAEKRRPVAFRKGTLLRSKKTGRNEHYSTKYVDIIEESSTKAQADTTLSLYFKEMAPIEVLKPEEEFESAKKIETIELTLWAHLLSFSPLLEVIIAILKNGQPEQYRQLEKIRRALRRLKSHKRSGPQSLSRRMALAQQIYAVDIDRQLLGQVLVELGLLRSSKRSTYLSARQSAFARNKAFHAFYQEAQTRWLSAQQARTRFIRSNLRLVVSIARRFNHGRMPLSDLIQEGNIGLIKAVERYDYRRGYRFSTYASWWIRHAITRAIADKGRAVRLPVHMLDAFQKVSRASRDLSTKLGRQPTIEEIGYSSGLSQEKVEKIHEYQLDQSLSLDRAVSDEDDRRFVELLCDPECFRPTEQLLDQSVSEQVQQILKDLKPIEADILQKRFGLTGAREQTLKEIGATYHLSRERIRQIQEQALAKIRRALQRRDAI